MEIIRGIEEYRSTGYCQSGAVTVVTLGKFDGIHVGHEKLIRTVVEYAHEHHLISLVFAIEMKDGSILSHGERSEYLERLGADVLLECPFSRPFMCLSPETFVREILAETLHAGYCVIGCDFAFGHNRQGSASDLKSLLGKTGCRTLILEKEQIRGEDVSSTRVRAALKEGDMELVRELLGRPYPVAGIVSHGRHIGTGIGVPTLNVIPEEGKILPPDGVYASLTYLPDRSCRKSLTNIGMRPTVGGKSRRAETTLLDFHSDLYGEEVCHELLAFLRPERKFSGLDELKEQIRKDRKAAWG